MGAVNTTYTFTATDTITSTKMNNIIDETTMTSDAIIGTTLEVASGKLKIRSAGITSNEIGANSITTTTIVDGAITPAKLSNSDFGDFTVASGVATIDANAITTAKILDSNVTPAKLSQPSTLATLQTATGTSVDFTGIPSWAKRVTVMFNGVSTNGTSSVLIQAGAGSVTTTGYLTGSAIITSGTAAVNNTNGFQVYLGSSDTAAALRSGSLVLNLIGSNAWAAQGIFALSNTNSISAVAGCIPLSGALDRIRVTTVIGSQNFDAGFINISYE